MRTNAYKCLLKIQSAIQENHLSMRKEPDSDGEEHDKWEDDDEAMQDLEDSIEEAVSAFEAAGETRKSVRRMSIEISG